MIPLNIGHDPRRVVGEVVHLERSPHPPRRLWLVAHSNWAPGDEDWYLSAETIRDDGGILLTGVGLTHHPLQRSNLPVSFLPGLCDWRGCTSRQAWASLDKRQAGMLERAAEAFVLRRGQPLHVYDSEPEHTVGAMAPNALLIDGELHATRAAYLDYPDRRPPGRMQHSAPHGGVLNVR